MSLFVCLPNTVISLGQPGLAKGENLREEDVRSCIAAAQTSVVLTVQLGNLHLCIFSPCVSLWFGALLAIFVDAQVLACYWYLLLKFDDDWLCWHPRHAIHGLFDMLNYVGVLRTDVNCSYKYMVCDERLIALVHVYFMIWLCFLSCTQGVCWNTFEKIACRFGCFHSPFLLKLSMPWHVSHLHIVDTVWSHGHKNMKYKTNWIGSQHRFWSTCGVGCPSLGKMWFTQMMGCAACRSSR